MYLFRSRYPRPNPLTDRYTSRWFMLPLSVVNSVWFSGNAAKPRT